MRPVAAALRAARLASCGSEVPHDLQQMLVDTTLREFVAGCTAERAGDDATALRHFEAAQGSGTLPEEFAARAASAVQRIRVGCAALHTPASRPAAE